MKAINISSTKLFLKIIINLLFRIREHFKGQSSAEMQAEKGPNKEQNGTKTEGCIVKIFLMEFIYSAIEFLTK